VELLADERGAPGIARLFIAALGAQRAHFDLLLAQVIAACHSHLHHGEFWLEYRTAVELADRYPRDAGVSSAGR
jgi:hypothetical protein